MSIGDSLVLLTRVVDHERGDMHTVTEHSGKKTAYWECNSHCLSICGGDIRFLFTYSDTFGDPAREVSRPC